MALYFSWHNNHSNVFSQYLIKNNTLNFVSEWNNVKDRRFPAINTTRSWSSTQGVSVHFRSVFFSISLSRRVCFPSVSQHFQGILLLLLLLFYFFGPGHTFKNWLGACLLFSRVPLKPPLCEKFSGICVRLSPQSMSQRLEDMHLYLCGVELLLSCTPCSIS